MQDLTAADVVRLLELKPHPEGGYFRETWRDERQVDGPRAASTLIYYLLDTGDVSDWHRVDAAEVWHWYAGAPLVITVSANGHDAEAHFLGPDLKARQRPQFVVPQGWWQTATSLGTWTGFDFAGFELAPPGWRPTPRGT
jgi:uncharacterized protein